jgi:glutamine synthetase
MGIEEILHGKQKEVLKKVEEEEIKIFYIQFTDIHGELNSFGYRAEQLKDSFKKGRAFDGSSIEGLGRIKESDKYIVPDPDSFTILPLREKDLWGNERTVAWFTGDMYNADGSLFEGDPRFVLKNNMEKAEKNNHKFLVAPEIEFFLFKKDGNGDVVFPLKPNDYAGYFDSHSKDLTYKIRNDIVDALTECKFKIEAIHHEVSPGQNEIGFQYDDALKTAERILMYKYIVSSIAEKNNLHASFMAKPIWGVNGSGMHVHENLADLKGNNLFYKKDKEISELGLCFIGGQLKHAKAICALAASTVNSYKRLVPGYEAPVNICWGKTNRSVLIRIPALREGEKKSIRGEFRVPDPKANPYLLFSAMYVAGMDGITNRIRPPKAMEENSYEYNPEMLNNAGIETLPGSLEKALVELDKDLVIKSSLGGCYESFVRAKKNEISKVNSQVTRSELELYL